MNSFAGPAPASNVVRAVVNVTSNWGGFAFSVVVAFFLAPFIVHTLGNTAYGAWVLLGSLVGYLGLLDVGVRSAVTKYVATKHALAEHEAAGRIVSAAFVMFSGLSLLAVVLAIVVAFFLLDAFDVPEELSDAARVVVIIGGVNIAVALVSGVFGGIVVGRQRFALLNGINVLTTAARALATVIALKAGGGLIALAIIQLGASVAAGYATLWASRRVYPELKFKLSGWARSDFRMILSFGMYASFLRVFASLTNYSDSVIIGAFLPISTITFFAIAASLMDYTRSVVSGISRTVAPMAGAMDTGDRSEGLHELLLKGGRYATLVALPILVTLMLRGDEFIGLWMGPEYAELAGEVVAILALSVWAGAGCQVSTVTMIGVNRHSGLVPALGLEAVLNVALSILLIGSMGIIGVAWGTTLPRLAICLIYSPWYAREVLGVPVREYLTEIVVRPSLSIIPFALVTYAMGEAWAPPNIWVFFAQVAVAMPAALIGAWFIGLTAGERHTYGPYVTASLRTVTMGRSQRAS